jgi:galactonate dehydratase
MKPIPTMRPTRIEKIETFLVDRWCLLRIVCEDGTVGIGEAGVHGWPAPTRAMLHAMEPYLLGKDPSPIEHHAQLLQRSSHFMGALISGAISAIDIALWDIKGKRLGVPVYELMGGKTRDRVRCYIHAHGDSLDELVADALKKKAAGFTAVRFSPFSPNYHLHQSFESWAAEAVRRVGALHEALAGDVDLCIELHRQMGPAESVALSARLEQFNPYFYEDPMLPDSPRLMGDLQARCRLPIATGERFTSVFQFQELLASKGCDFIRPDLCLCMGLTGSKKAAALAEAHHVKVIPHNPLSPVSTAACVQLDACIPNFALQEYTGEAEYPKRELVVEPLRLVNGYLEVPDAPGLGIALNEEKILGLPASTIVPNMRIGVDGSVQDW